MSPSFHLIVNTENDAFGEKPKEEIVRILRNVASQLERGDNSSYYRILFDINGNACGHTRLEQD